MSTPTELERVVEELFGKDPLRSRSFENKIRKALTAEREAGAREEREANCLAQRKGTIAVRIGIRDNAEQVEQIQFETSLQRIKESKLELVPLLLEEALFKILTESKILPK